MLLLKIRFKLTTFLPFGNEFHTPTYIYFYMHRYQTHNMYINRWFRWASKKKHLSILNLTALHTSLFYNGKLALLTSHNLYFVTSFLLNIIHVRSSFHSRIKLNSITKTRKKNSPWQQTNHEKYNFVCFVF